MSYVAGTLLLEGTWVPLGRFGDPCLKWQTVRVVPGFPQWLQVLYGTCFLHISLGRRKQARKGACAAE